MVVGDAIADLRFSEEAEAEMSEQSLFRRSAPYKSYSGSKKKRLNVKCCGVTVRFIVSKAIENVPESVFKDC